MKIDFFIFKNFFMSVIYFDPLCVCPQLKLHLQIRTELGNSEIKINSTFHYGGTRVRDRQQVKGPYTPLSSSENDPKTSFNQQQSLSGEILHHFDINNLSVAQKLKKLGNLPLLRVEK